VEHGQVLDLPDPPASTHLTYPAYLTYRAYLAYLA
jgi:hypothetical protein